jgi:methyl-accepting chemotaxis protein
MRTRIATSLAAGSSSQAAATLVAKLRADLDGATPALITLFASTAQPLAEIMSAVAAAFPRSMLLGSSTAGEFTESGDANGSTAAFAVAGDYRCFGGVGHGLKADPEAALREAIEGLPLEVNGFPHRTALLLLDPLSGNGEETTLLASSLLGDSVRLAGGAAGDDLHMKATFVACGGDVASDAVAVGLIFSKAPLGVGVCHGHTPISRPLRVTAADGNVVREIEGRPAWSVWLDAVRPRARERGVDVDALTKDEEGAFLLRYEAGLAAGESGQQYKIRAPLSRDDAGAVSFACGIPEGSVIRITESEPKSQIASAHEAARRAMAQLGGPCAGALVFDCICRALILGPEFATAVRGMSHELGDVPIAGFETYGEIALDAGDMSGFHNTTSVVLAFPWA